MRGEFALVVTQRQEGRGLLVSGLLKSGSLRSGLRELGCGLRVAGCVIVDAISWKKEPPAAVMFAPMSQTNGANARRMVRMPLAFGVA